MSPNVPKCPQPAPQPNIRRPSQTRAANLGDAVFQHVRQRPLRQRAWPQCDPGHAAAPAALGPHSARTAAARHQGRSVETAQGPGAGRGTPPGPQR
jgi:hypothetical protein